MSDRRPESTIEKALRLAVIAAGGTCEKVVSKSRRGWPDRLVLLPGGRLILVETKRPRGGRLAPHQRLIHAELRALGFRVEVVKTEDDIGRLLAAPSDSR